jgi:[ribosomal protein S5]-alanine N-acetyltransferase
MTQSTLATSRLELVPVTLALVEAAILDKPEAVEQLLRAELPRPWIGRALIEQAFAASLDAIRQDPATRLWGDRIALVRDGDLLRVAGSVIFHGCPSADGTVEVGYGMLPWCQGRGYATEATEAQVRWALAQPAVRRVRATTPEWHRGSVRVLEKIGFRCEGTQDHEHLGEVRAYCIEAP